MSHQVLATSPEAASHKMLQLTYSADAQTLVLSRPEKGL